MIVGPWPAPMAVLTFVLYASFWNAVVVIFSLGFASLNRSTVFLRMVSPGGPVRIQYEAAPAPPPASPPPPPLPCLVGPELPQEASAPTTGAPSARLRKVRRDVVLGSTLISELQSRSPATASDRVRAVAAGRPGAQVS